MGIVINDILVTDMIHKTWKIKYLSETHMERQIQMQTRQEPTPSLTEKGWCLAFDLSVEGLGHSEVGATGLRGQTELGSHPVESCCRGSILEPHCFPCKRGTDAMPFVRNFWDFIWHSIQHTPADHHLPLSGLLTALPSNVCAACS